MVSRRQLYPLAVRVGRAERGFYVAKATERGLSVSSFIKMALHAFEPVNLNVNANVDNAAPMPDLAAPQRSLEHRVERIGARNAAWIANPSGFTD